MLRTKGKDRLPSVLDLILALDWALRNPPKPPPQSRAQVLKTVSIISIMEWRSTSCLSLPLSSYCWHRITLLALSVTPFPPLSPSPSHYVISPHQKSSPPSSTLYKQKTDTIKWDNAFTDSLQGVVLGLTHHPAQSWRDLDRQGSLPSSRPAGREKTNVT